MDTTELILTALVLDRAKALRLDAETPPGSADLNLEDFITPAIKQLMAWHPIVMEAVHQHKTGA